MKLSENFSSLYSGEEFIREKAIKYIEASEHLSLHVSMIEAAMDIIDHFVNSHTAAEDDQKTIQLLGIRVFNGAASTMKLGLSGYYQTAALQERDILETSFLLDYFLSNGNAISEWLACDEEKRLKKFSPVVIRKALDVRDNFTSHRRKEHYKMFSVLAGHATYQGFRMLTPVPGGDAHCGPFFAAGSLEAVIAELARLMVQAGEAFIRFFKSKIRKDLEMRVAFLEKEWEWFKEFYDREFDRSVLDEIKTLLSRSSNEAS